VARLLVLPIVSSALGNVDNFLKGGDHLGLKVAEIVLDGTACSEVSVERNIFLILRVHTDGSAVGSGSLLEELKVLETIEAITDVLVDLLRVVTVGQDIQKGLVRNEVEASEDLLFGFKVVE
jgi:hypothetical protein